MEKSIILNIRVSMASLSLIGSLAVILLICLYQKYGFYFQRLILYYGIVSFLSSTAYIVGRVNYNPTTDTEMILCKAQGIWLMYTDWMVLLCNFGIVFNLVRGVFLLKNSITLEILFLFCSFIIPALPTFILLYRNPFGPSGLWCWLQCTENSTQSSIFPILVWYCPLYTLILIMFVMYLLALVVTHVQRVKWHGLYDPKRDETKREQFNNARSLLGYPCILFVINVFPFVHRMYQFIRPSDVQFSLYLLHVIFSPLPGVLMLFVYAFDRQTIRRLKWDHIKGVFSKSASVQAYRIERTHEDNAAVWHT